MPDFYQGQIQCCPPSLSPPPHLHTKETRTRQDTASIGHPVPGLMKRGIRCVPAGGWSLECPLLGVKVSAFASLGRHFSCFRIPRPGGQVQWSALPAKHPGADRGQDKGSRTIPSTTVQAEHQPQVSEGPQGGFTGQRRQGTNQDKDHNLATPKLKLERA